MDRVDGHESVMILPASWYLTNSPGLGHYPILKGLERGFVTIEMLMSERTQSQRKGIKLKSGSLIPKVKKKLNLDTGKSLFDIAEHAE